MEGGRIFMTWQVFNKYNIIKDTSMYGVIPKHKKPIFFFMLHFVTDKNLIVECLHIIIICFAILSAMNSHFYAICITYDMVQPY